ncbi:MAG: hypothetical protein H8D72_00870 [Planctomycetes bacterium]|nr:hypothetical protein [Planctomycetota bacterium]
MDIWKKLNWKEGTAVVVLDAPASFQETLESCAGPVTTRWKAGLEFVLVFALTRKAIEKLATRLAKDAQGDVTVWVAYPKKSSKRYQCDFHRDSGWEPLGAAGFEGVRQVAIDADWSALRFRRVEFITSLKRAPERRLSDEGRKRSS